VKRVQVIILTDDLTAAGRLPGIDVLDHLIVARDAYFSIANQQAYLLIPEQ